jgi:hypothetical protein
MRRSSDSVTSRPLTIWLPSLDPLGRIAATIAGTLMGDLPDSLDGLAGAGLVFTSRIALTAIFFMAWDALRVAFFFLDRVLLLLMDVLGVPG